MKPDYGIDAPGVRTGMFVVGGCGVVVLAIAAMLAHWSEGLLSNLAAVAAALAGIFAVYGTGMGSYMTYGSRLGKLRTREQLLDLVHAEMGWTGRETVLDVGCGRGLMLIGAARRLTTGTAVGIDLWRLEDQAGNTPEATLQNARLEGVADRVRVETGDARALPFESASFDVVLSHWVVHNLEDPADRACVLREMLRVLRPGGSLVLADIAHFDEYLSLLAPDVGSMRISTGGWESRVIGILSGGTFRPQALIAQKN